jgi:glycosyltransferase involved in cell wall biosynthesis
MGLEKQVIVVNECSADQTAEFVARFDEVTLLEHEVNSGKGMAVRTGLDQATDDYLIIQDAGLEYDPNDYIGMLQPLPSDNAHLVYGGRYMKYPNAGVIKKI